MKGRGPEGAVSQNGLPVASCRLSVEPMSLRAVCHTRIGATAGFDRQPKPATGYHNWLDDAKQNSSPLGPDRSPFRTHPSSSQYAKLLRHLPRSGRLGHGPVVRLSSTIGVCEAPENEDPQRPKRNFAKFPLG